MKKRSIKRIVSIVLCSVIVLSFLPSAIAFSAKAIVKNLDETNFVGGYRVSNIIGKTELDKSVYIGRDTVVINGKEYYYDYYFPKRWYVFLIHDFPFYERANYGSPYVCVILNDVGEITEVTRSHLIPEELYNKAMDIRFSDNYLDVTYSETVRAICMWWIAVWRMIQGFIMYGM